MADLAHTNLVTVPVDETVEREAARVRGDARATAAGHVLDAVECLTDDHVRAYAVAHQWFDLLAGTEPHTFPTEEVGERIASAMKSLTAAQADLADLDQLVGEHVGTVATDRALARGVDSIEFFWHTDRRAWQWTCDLCTHGQLAGGVPLDDLVEIAAAHLEHHCPEYGAREVGTTADGRTVRGRIDEEAPGRWRWMCSACPARSTGTYPTEDDARGALTHHVEATRREVHP